MATEISPVAVPAPAVPGNGAPPSAPAAPVKRARKTAGMPVHLALVVRLNKLNRKVNHAAGALGRWGLAAQSTALREASARLADTSKELTDLPAEWTPPKKPVVVSKELASGTKVLLREKFREGYSGFMDANAKLTVSKAAGKFVVCKVEGGSDVVVPRGHLELAAA